MCLYFCVHHLWHVVCVSVSVCVCVIMSVSCISSTSLAFTAGRRRLSLTIFTLCPCMHLFVYVLMCLFICVYLCIGVLVCMAAQGTTRDETPCHVLTVLVVAIPPLAFARCSRRTVRTRILFFLLCLPWLISTSLSFPTHCQLPSYSTFCDLCGRAVSRVATLTTHPLVPKGLRACKTCITVKIPDTCGLFNCNWFHGA